MAPRCGGSCAATLTSDAAPTGRSPHLASHPTAEAGTGKGGRAPPAAHGDAAAARRRAAAPPPSPRARGLSPTRRRGVVRPTRPRGTEARAPVGFDVRGRRRASGSGRTPPLPAALARRHGCVAMAGTHAQRCAIAEVSVGWVGRAGNDPSSTCRGRPSLQQPPPPHVRDAHVAVGRAGAAGAHPLPASTPRTGTAAGTLSGPPRSHGSGAE